MMRMFNVIRISLLMFSLFAVGAASHALAANFYVSPTGSDAADGSFANPWRTIQKGANSVSAGDTVFVRGGTYKENVVVDGVQGTAGNWITFKNYQNEKVVIEPSKKVSSWTSLGGNVYESDALGFGAGGKAQNLWKEGALLKKVGAGSLTSDGRFSYNSSTDKVRVYSTTDPNSASYHANSTDTAFAVRSSEYVRVDGLTTQYTYNGFMAGSGGATDIADTHHVEFLNSESRYMGNWGFVANGSAANPTQDILFKNNVAHDGDEHGFMLASSEVAKHSKGVVFDNNTAYNNEWHGFQVAEGWDNVTIKQSIAYDNNTGMNSDGAGFRIGSAVQVDFYENLSIGLSQSNQYGLVLDKDASKVIVLRNTFMNNNVGVWVPDLSDIEQDNLVSNFFYDNVNGGLRINHANDLYFGDNLLASNVNPQILELLGVNTLENNQIYTSTDLFQDDLFLALASGIDFADGYTHYATPFQLGSGEDSIFYEGGILHFGDIPLPDSQFFDAGSGSSARFGIYSGGINTVAFDLANRGQFKLVKVAPIPEPGTLLMVGLGLLGVLASRKK